MFFDEAKIYVKSGDGGRGMVSFRREKHVPQGGPDGGDGGHGGAIVFVVNAKINSLVRFHRQVHHRAENGLNGHRSKRTGATAPDLRYAKWFFWDPDLTRQFLTTRHRLGRLLHAAGFEIIESAYRLDSLGWPWWYLIYHGTKLVPYRLLEGLTRPWNRRDLSR